jgi:hypothetical protein
MKTGLAKTTYQRVDSSRLAAYNTAVQRGMV